VKHLDFAIRTMRDTDLPAVAEIEAGVFTDWYRMNRKPQDPLPERSLASLRYTVSLDPDANLVAIAEDGAMVGFILARTWGRVGWFGTFGVPTQFQGLGIGSALVDHVTRYLRPRTDVIGLETMPESGPNLGLYAKAGFGVTFPTIIMDLSLVRTAERYKGLRADELRTWSSCDAWSRRRALSGVREISNALLPGLDYSCEVAAYEKHELGDTFLVEGRDGRLEGFAVLRTVPFRGRDSSGRGYIHILAIHPGADGRQVLVGLLRQVWCRGAARGLTQIVTGVNGRYRDAMGLLLDGGFRGVRASIRMASVDSLPGVFTVASGVDLSRWAG
jgi:ribosomal protein S18 acetylase RimI-like enzyme